MWTFYYPFKYAINDSFITIQFKGGSSFNAILQTSWDLQNGTSFISGENWSFNTNKLINGGLSHKRGCEKANVLTIINRIEQLRKNCTDYKERENAILNIDCSIMTRKVLMDNLYASSQTFATCLISQQPDLSQYDQNKNIVDKIEDYNKLQQELSSQRISLDQQSENLKNAKKEKEKLLEESGFFFLSRH